MTRSVRLACAVFLKNRVRRSYVIEDEQKEGDNVISPSDRVAIQRYILPLLVSAPTRTIRIPLAETLRFVISHDYPEKWPALLNDIKTLLQSSQVKEVVAGCTAVLEIVKVFRCVNHYLCCEH